MSATETEKTKERRGKRGKEHFQSPSLPRNNTQIESESWFVLTWKPRSKYLGWLKLTTLYILLAVGPSVPSTYILWNHHPHTIRQPFKAMTELSITTSKTPLAWLAEMPLNSVLSKKHSRQISQAGATGHSQRLNYDHGAPFISQPNPENSQSQEIFRLRSVLPVLFNPSQGQGC